MNLSHKNPKNKKTRKKKQQPQIKISLIDDIKEIDFFKTIKEKMAVQEITEIEENKLYSNRKNNSSFLEYDFTIFKKLIDKCINEIDDNLQEKPPIVVMGKQCNQNRDIGFFSDESEGYRYSNQIMRSTPLKRKIGRLLKLINETFNSEYNGILVNRYNDGTEYIGAHSDSETGLDTNIGVLMISVGSVRKFRIRKKNGKFSDGSNFKDFLTKNYHVYIMQGDFQKHYTHEIPIEKKVKETRYSLTFRKHEK